MQMVKLDRMDACGRVAALLYGASFVLDLGATGLTVHVARRGSTSDDSAALKRDRDKVRNDLVRATEVLQRGRDERSRRLGSGA